MEGRIEVRFDNSEWGVVCGDGWGVREAIVACKQLGLKYAASAVNSADFGGGNMPRVVSGISCKGNEQNLLHCDHDDVGNLFCPGEGMHDIAGVVCTDRQADLQPDLQQLMTSAYLEDKTIFLLQCAMEENCLASQAYVERHDSYRRLLRFTTAIANVGSADFRPFIPKSLWEWHACHQVGFKVLFLELIPFFSTIIPWKHSHILKFLIHWGGELLKDIRHPSASRTMTALVLIVTILVQIMATRLNSCLSNAFLQRINFQGISAGCTDVYYNNIDCQWIDITDLPVGTYVFKMAINPEYKIAEVTFENNAALCVLYYSQMTAVINNCTLVRP